MATPKQIISNTKYAEFYDVLVTLQLCRAMAIRERGKIGQRLRACASQVAKRVSNRTLASTLETMAGSLFPETELRRIADCIRRMESHLGKELRGENVTAEMLEEVAAMEIA
ncbi:hypothetical protein BEE12_16150 [Pantoea agglomerans]|uniref:DUF7740 domain-containing protein n=1 Tax=Enterobacter agglomerans TaxID=549 RepID=UPI00083D7C45|nr:hypothetical protein [Pantoea agglomerans]AOE41249.1 hypothetical protein BEE12_16150 [Pantoea agglomerans]